jgi:hypothetical protein
VKHSKDRQSKSAARIWLVGALVAAGAIPVLAAGEDAGRYSMQPTEGGVVRLDRETGAMSFCTGKDGAWSCKDMAVQESEMKKRVDELEGEKRALEAEKRLREHEGPSHEGPLGGPVAKAPEPGSPPAGDTEPPAPPGDLPVPNERDVDKLFDYVEGMVKKFKERIDRLEREAKKQPDVPL